jgi:hypothetical protein
MGKYLKHGQNIFGWHNKKKEAAYAALSELVFSCT